ncbi:MAG: hypothetical protein PHU32_06065 [Candidatus ainarchaeum sp.]|nr:hypothetical protein [Candidatus ainarchaeum sp.]
MKKTFAQLKRDLKVGVKVKQIKNEIWGTINDEIREISKVQTNAVAFRTNKNGKIIDSWLWLPESASEVDYQDDVFYFKSNNLMIGYKIIKE